MSTRRKHVRTNRRVRVPYANLHDADDSPPYPGADEEWKGTPTRVFPHGVDTSLFLQGCPYIAATPVLAHGTVDDPAWQSLSELPDDDERFQAMERQWAEQTYDETLNAPGATFEEWRYLNWDAFSCSEWVAGYRALVAHAPGGWNPRKSESVPESEALSDYSCVVIDKGERILGSVQPRHLRSSVGDMEELSGATAFMNRLRLGDDYWPTRAEAQEAGSMLLTANAQNRPTHARLAATALGTPIMHYLVGQASLEDNVFFVDEPDGLTAWIPQNGDPAQAVTLHQSY